MEEAPKKASQVGSDDEVRLLTLSARSKAALQQAVAELADHLHQQPATHLQDVAHTLREGRQTFDWRATITASTIEQAREKLQRGLNKPSQALASPEVALLFPGQGLQYWGWLSNSIRRCPRFVMKSATVSASCGINSVLTYTL
nr:hypothetical protein PJ912_15960 [Pectobacterium colocasium]